MAYKLGLFFNFNMLKNSVPGKIIVESTRINYPENKIVVSTRINYPENKIVVSINED